MKKLLCIVTSAPFRNSYVIEQFEAAMVAAVFDMEVSILFLDEGAYNLVSDQAGQLVGARSPGKLIEAMEMYEIKNLYVANDNGLATLPDSVQSLDTDAQRSLIAAQDFVIQ